MLSGAIKNVDEDLAACAMMLRLNAGSPVDYTLIHRAIDELLDERNVLTSFQSRYSRRPFNLVKIPSECHGCGP